MPSKLRYVRSRTQKIKLKGHRPLTIPKRDWKGPGLYYRREGRWVK